MSWSWSTFLTIDHGVISRVSWSWSVPYPPPPPPPPPSYHDNYTGNHDPPPQFMFSYQNEREEQIPCPYFQYFRFTVKYTEESLENPAAITKSCGPGNFSLALAGIIYKGCLLGVSSALGWDCRKLPGNYRVSWK